MAEEEEGRWARLAAAAEEYETLIWTVGPGFHPDTPFEDYEPPISQFTFGEFYRILDTAVDAGVDLCSFGLHVQRDIMRSRVVTYLDGSRSDQVVREEVDEAVNRWALYPVETILKTLEWSKAAQDAFSEAFKEKYGTED